MTGSPGTVVLAGGGSGGHVFPLLALADCLRRRWPQVRVVALGTAEGLEARLVPAHGYELAVLPRVPLPRRLSVDLVRLPGRLRSAVAAARCVVRAADVVVGFGGYVSTPAYLAARRAGVPIVVHEANARPGLANRLGARLTEHVGVATAGTPLRHARHVGMPLRREITTLDRFARRDEARRTLGLDLGRPTLLVMGGSLGARKLNQAFGALAPELASAGVQVLHVAGAGKTVPGVDAGAQPPVPYVVVPFVERMELAFAAADLVVCRAGANTVAEVTAVGLPAAYVPLPVGNGEQRLNAAPLVAAGAALLVADSELTTGWARDVALELVRDDVRLAAMSAAAGRHAVRDGAEQLATLVAEAVGAP